MQNMGLDALEIRFRLEKRFGIEIRGPGLNVAFHTAGSLAELVWQKLQETLVTKRPTGAEQFTREECWEGVREVLADVLVIKPDQIRPDCHLIDDLGMG
jgi:acyl carrier protein